jgi:hypothetical protein
VVLYKEFIEAESRWLRKHGWTPNNDGWSAPHSLQDPRHFGHVHAINRQLVALRMCPYATSEEAIAELESLHIAYLTDSGWAKKNIDMWVLPYTAAYELGKARCVSRGRALYLQRGWDEAREGTPSYTSAACSVCGAAAGYPCSPHFGWTGAR